MNHKATITQALVLVSAVALAPDAQAVSYHSEWHAQRTNTVGTTTIVLPPNASRFCYLSRVSVVDTDTSGERAQCRVRRSGTVWLLEAYLGTSSDADVYCSAICYNN